MTQDRRYDEQLWLIASLQDPRAYDPPVDHVELVETHISYVLLTGEFAYKIKKPVDLGFLDFTDLGRRRHFCHEEVRLNRRTAPELYLEVVPVTGSPQRPRLGGPGEPIEYAVKMRQFPEQCRADRMLARNALTADHIENIAAALADFHARIETAGPDSPFGTPEQIHRPVTDNYEAVGALLHDDTGSRRLEALRDWSDQAFDTLRPRLAQRRRDGFVRECHGDMHLGNLVMLDGRVVPFDCIEFNPGLRWIDVMSEVAFLAMDLADHGRRDYAWGFVNTYLEHTGDYAGTALLPYYQAYRAMVRAKVCRLRLAQSDLPPAQREALERDYQGYVGLAQQYTRPAAPALYITFGLSGSGKSTVARAVSAPLGAIRIRSDVERKRLFGLPPRAHSQSAPRQGLYTQEASGRTYTRLAELAATLLQCGYPVVVDATFLEGPERARFRGIAEDHGVPFAIIETRAPDPVLRARIAPRLAAGRDASEADAAVLDHQLQSGSALSRDERARTVTVDTAQSLALDDVLHQLKALTSPFRGDH